jgi:hypothetical protein
MVRSTYAPSHLCAARGQGQANVYGGKLALGAMAGLVVLFVLSAAHETVRMQA